MSPLVQLTTDNRLGTNLDIAGLEDTPDNRQKMVDSIPLKRMCKASDVGNLVCFLCSDEADYITGAQVPVDGERII
jgi:3-oxoacyl-[acyl-carrier protein] reductase